MQNEIANRETRITSDMTQRREMMRVLAHAQASEIAAVLASLPVPDYADLRKPEVGLVMLRGRVGGDGAPFNVGEATVTRAAVRLATGEVGSSYLLGRQPEKARQAALIDAIWQTPEGRAAVEMRILHELRLRLAERVQTSTSRTAATKVDFFTLVRGEDA